MSDLVGSLLGVPAVILIAGGMGIVAVTLVSRVRARLGTAGSAGGMPIRWAHLVLGVGLAAAGLLLLQADIALVGVH